MQLTFSWVDPQALKPHSRNRSIYGDEDVSELVELIRQSGWVKPLVVTPTGTIVSGNRRWKAALELGLESVPVEVREFPDATAELEALLLENASRVKTTEQKVREALVWREIETFKAKLRQKASLKLGNHTPVQENFPERERGQARDRIADRVGLGSGRSYEKAAKVVTQIDEEANQGHLEIAQALRRVLNEQSVDAAHQLLKKQAEERAKILATIASGQAKNTKEAQAILQGQLRKRQGGHSATEHSAGVSPSCWNCQHRGEPIENHSFYCYRLGALSLLEKSASARGAECNLWSYQGADADEATNKTQPPNETFVLTLPAHLQPLLQDAARQKGMSVVDWATWVLESEARATCCPSGCSDCSATQQSDETECQATPCRGP